MNKQPDKLTKIQAKALNFIKWSSANSGTAPTLRELCSHMGYSAIGSAQDLVAALRKKGFLHTPTRQAARSLILTHKAIALYEDDRQCSESTLVVNCLSRAPLGGRLSLSGPDILCTMRMSVAMFQRPYPLPERLFGIQVSDDRMATAGIVKGDWAMFEMPSSTELPFGDVVVICSDDQDMVGRLLQDGEGAYLCYGGDRQSCTRLQEGRYELAGRMIALQRIVAPRDLVH